MKPAAPVTATVPRFGIGAMSLPFLSFVVERYCRS
jgi:hypothetical protein